MISETQNKLKDGFEQCSFLRTNAEIVGKL